MKPGHRARWLWFSLINSLWFIPALIVALSLLLAVILVEASARVDTEALTRYPRLFGAGAAGSRGMLSTIAGSVITVAGVTFSITIAALALASAQYTPRVLRTFMGDRPNQIVLGTFVGVYAYCLVVLRTIRGGDEGAFVPSIAVLGGFALALLSVGVLIFFIHHIADALQASTILTRVRETTNRAIDSLFPDSMGEDADDVSPPTAPADADWTPVPSRLTGYVQSVDAEGLLEHARTHGVVVRMEAGVGDFITSGMPLASLASTHSGSAPGGEQAVKDLNDLYVIRSHRTVEQDAAFGIIQIVDIARKALSSGINDTTTALSSLDHLAALLARLAGRRIAPRARTDDSVVRVIAKASTFEELVFLAFDDLRRQAEGNVPVLMRLLGSLETVARFTRSRARLAVLERQLELVRESIERSVPGDSDRTRLLARVREVDNRLRAPVAAT